MKLSKRESRLVTVALAAVVIFVYYLYFLSPKIDEYFELKENMEVSEKKLGNLQKTESELSNLLDEIEKSKNDIAHLETIVPSNKKLPEIIVHLENFSADTGVELKEVSFESTGENKDKKSDKKGEDSQNKDYIEIPIKLTIVGSYDEILRFLESLEDSRRLYSVNNIAVAREYKIADNSIGVNIGLNAFAIKHNDLLMEEPESYDFMKGDYGRENPFKPLPIEKSTYKSTPANNKGSVTNSTTDEFLSDFMERLFRQILENASN